MQSQTQLNALFFGSSAYCLPILEVLRDTCRLAAIITRADAPLGRKNVLTPTPPHQFAIKANVPVFTPKYKEELLSIYSALEKYHPDIAIVADYGLIIPEKIFTLPKQGTVNIHFSKLPEFRGAAPVQYTLLRGDPTAWITIQKLEKDLDTGDVLWQKDTPIGEKETSEELYDKLFKVAATSLPYFLNEYAVHRITPRPQDHARATYTRRLTREDGFIPWEILSAVIGGKQVTNQQLPSWPLYNSILKSLYSNLQPPTSNLQPLIYNIFRAFSPWPGLWTMIGIRNHESGIMGEKRLKILKLHCERTTHNAQPITKLVIDEVQLEGKQSVSWKQFQDAFTDLFRS